LRKLPGKRTLEILINSQRGKFSAEFYGKWGICVECTVGNSYHDTLNNTIKGNICHDTLNNTIKGNGCHDSLNIVLNY